MIVQEYDDRFPSPAPHTRLPFAHTCQSITKGMPGNQNCLCHLICKLEQYSAGRWNTDLHEKHQRSHSPWHLEHPRNAMARLLHGQTQTCLTVFHQAAHQPCIEYEYHFFNRLIDYSYNSISVRRLRKMAGSAQTSVVEVCSTSHSRRCHIQGTHQVGSRLSAAASCRVANLRTSRLACTEYMLYAHPSQGGNPKKWLYM
jgi:hypothetical protein